MDRTVLVTGGGRGIGAAICRRLAFDGWRVFVNYLSDAASADALAREVDGVALQADVSDPDQVERLFDAAGAVDALVNNAGATLHIGPLADTPVEVIRRVLDVNLLSAVWCSREAARRFGPGGGIVNISSAGAVHGAPGEYVHYAAAKSGVETLTVGLAKELAPRGIRVNAVSPGLVRTGIHAAAGDPDRLDRATARVPLGRPGEPDEIAPAVAWLLSDEASYTTGAVLRISGGL